MIFIIMGAKTTAASTGSASPSIERTPRAVNR
jgi:hypothetical protein